MNYRLFGNTGLRVSQLCLGTMTFGQKGGWGSDGETSHKILDAYFAHGGNFIDTANVYADGNSEAIVGRWLQAQKGRRHKAVLSTKYTLTTDPSNPNASGSHRKNLFESLEESLKRLQTDAIDILWVHSDDVHTDAEETMRALDDLVRMGKVFYIGVSNVPAWKIARANTLAKLRGWTAFAGMQIYYSLIDRTAERELLPMAKAMNLATTVWSPLAGGLLTGKYLQKGNQKQKQASRLAAKKTTILKDSGNREDSIVKQLASLAEKSGVEAHHMALAWMIRKKNIGTIVPIIGAKTVAQLLDNFKCLGEEMPDEAFKRLEAVSAQPMGYPHDFLKHQSPSLYGDHRDNIV